MKDQELRQRIADMVHGRYSERVNRIVDFIKENYRELTKKEGGINVETLDKE